MLKTLEKGNKITAALAKTGMAAAAIALALGLNFGDKLDTEAASGKVIIYNTDPNSVTEQICSSKSHRGRDWDYQQKGLHIVKTTFGMAAEEQRRDRS